MSGPSNIYLSKKQSNTLSDWPDLRVPIGSFMEDLRCLSRNEEDMSEISMGARHKSGDQAARLPSQ